MLYRNLRLLIKVATAHLGGKFIFIPLIFIGFGTVRFNFLRNGADMRFTEWRLSMVGSKLNQTEVNLAL